MNSAQRGGGQPARSRQNPQHPELSLNFLPVKFTTADFEAGVVPYESAEQLEELRSRLSSTHSVVRQQARIICVPFIPDAEMVGETARFDTEGANLSLVAYLLQAELRRLLTERWQFMLRRFDPLIFVSRLPNRDLMERALDGRGVSDGLHVYPEYHLDVRRSGPLGFPGIVVGLKTRYEIDAPVSEQLRSGMHVLGRYVLTEMENAGHRAFQDPCCRRKLAGVIHAVKGDHLVLSTEAGRVEVAASQAWLEPRRDNFLDALAATTGPAAPNITDALDHQVFKLTGAEGRRARTAEIGSSLMDAGPFIIANGIEAAVGVPLMLPRTVSRRTHWRLAEPSYVFDLGGEKKHRFPDIGLTEFGPFDSEGFTPKTPRIAVVAPVQHRGVVEGFIRNFRDGVPASRAFAQGFTRKYRLTDCNFRFIAFNGDVRDAGAYRKACLQALEDGDPLDLALVIISSEQEHLLGDASPYLVAKSTFMSQGVPVQEFQVENISRQDIAHPLNTMALACYAKLGGTPFVISTPYRPMAHELVIGIGSAHVRSNRMGPTERYVGITTVFNSDGNYLVSNVSGEARYEDYPEHLLRALRDCIEDVKQRNGWQPADTIRLVFHVFKPLKDRETRAVKELAQTLTRDYAAVEFAFLHVSDQHPWMLIDALSDGIKQGRIAKGRFVPDRGHAVRISRSEVLVSVSGPRDLKQAIQGAPRPLLLKLHRESTFLDMDYLAGQVYRFTAMSWRRPYPSSQPVTILYSDLIAGLLGQLRQVTNWNSDLVSTKLRWSRWFL